MQTKRNSSEPIQNVHMQNQIFNFEVMWKAVLDLPFSSNKYFLPPSNVATEYNSRWFTVMQFHNLHVKTNLTDTWERYPSAGLITHALDIEEQQRQLTTRMRWYGQWASSAVTRTHTNTDINLHMREAQRCCRGAAVAVSQIEQWCSSALGNTQHRHLT